MQWLSAYCLWMYSSNLPFKWSRIGGGGRSKMPLCHTRRFPRKLKFNIANFEMSTGKDISIISATMLVLLRQPCIASTSPICKFRISFLFSLFSLKMHPFSDFPPKKRKRLKIDNEARGILRNFLRGGGRRVLWTIHHHVFIVGPSEKIARFPRVMEGGWDRNPDSLPLFRIYAPCASRKQVFFSFSGEWVWAGRYIARKWGK